MLSNLNSYQLNQGGKKYILTTSLIINSIRVTCRDANGQIYNRDFTIEDLKTLNTIFDMVKTPLQALEYIDKALKVQEVGVEQQNGIIKIIFFIKMNGINNKVEIPLGKVGPEFLSSVQKLLKNGEFITLPFHPKKLLGEINSIKQSSNLNNLGPITFDKNDNKLLVELKSGSNAQIDTTQLLGQQSTTSNINEYVSSIPTTGITTTSEHKYIPTTQVSTAKLNEYNIPTTQTTISNINGSVPTNQATTTTTTQLLTNYIPSSSETQLSSNFAPAISTTKTPITNAPTFGSFSQPPQVQTQTRIKSYDNAGDNATQLSFQELTPNNISQLIPETTTSAAIDSTTTNLGGFVDTQTPITQYPTYDATTTTQQVSNLPKSTVTSTTQRKAYTLPTTTIPNITTESPFPKTTLPRIQQSHTNANAFDINKLLKNEPIYSQNVPYGQTHTSRAKSYDSKTYNITPTVRPSAPKTSYGQLATGYGLLSPQKTSNIQRGYLSPKAQRINIPIEKGFDFSTNVTSGVPQYQTKTTHITQTSELPQYQTVSNLPGTVQTLQVPTTSQDFDYEQFISKSQAAQTQNENQFPGTIQTLQIPTTTQEYLNKSQAVQTQKDTTQISKPIQTLQVPTTSQEFDYQQFINKSQAAQTQNENQFPGTVQTLQIPTTSQDFDYQQLINKSQAAQTQKGTTQVSRPIQTSQIPTTSQDFDYQQLINKSQAAQTQKGTAQVSRPIQTSQIPTTSQGFDYQQYLNKSQAAQTQNENQFPGTIQTLQAPTTSQDFDYQQFINKSQAAQTQNDTTQVSKPIQTSQIPTTSQDFDYQQLINKSQAAQTQKDTTQVSRPIQTSQIPTTSQGFDYQQFINKSQAAQTQNDAQVSRPIQTLNSLQQPKINELYKYQNVPRIPQNVENVQYTQETSSYSQVPQMPISHQISQIPNANINIPSQRKLIIPIESTAPDYKSPITLSLPRTHEEQENIREEPMEYNQEEYQQEPEPKYELNPVPSLPQISPLDLNRAQFVKSTQTINDLLNRGSQANLDDADNYDQFRTTSRTRRTQNQIFSNPPPQVIPQPQIMSPLQQSIVPNYNDDRIKKLLDDTDSLKNKHHFLKDKLNELTGKINSYKNKIKAIEDEKKLSEVNALKAENEAIKQQISQLSKMKDSSAEVQMFRDQLKELDPLRQKAYELELLKGRLDEINDLREKVNELSGVKDQLGEIENLKLQISQISDMEEQLGELSTLRIQAADAENLRRKIEQMETEKVQYEEEIKSLRNTQRLSDLRNTGVLSNMSNILSPGMESKHLLFEEKQQNQYIKGDIIHNMNELEMITRKINKSNGKITLNLLYKATADSDKASAFHERCDDANSTLVLIETDKGKRFGGFTTCNWRGECIEKKDEEAFVFSLDKMMVYENIPGEDAIGCYPKFGPIFLGCQIRIYDNAFSRGGTTFEKGLNYNTEEDYELTGGDRTFGVKEIEVYEVIAQ